MDLLVPLQHPDKLLDPPGAMCLDASMAAARAGHQRNARTGIRSLSFRRSTITWVAG